MTPEDKTPTALVKIPPPPREDNAYYARLSKLGFLNPNKRLPCIHRCVAPPADSRDAFPQVLREGGPSHLRRSPRSAQRHPLDYFTGGARLSRIPAHFLRRIERGKQSLSYFVSSSFTSRLLLIYRVPCLGFCAFGFLLD